MKQFSLPFLMSGFLVLSGCADGNYLPYKVDDKFGQTTRQIAKVSIADPQAAENPPADSPKRRDGYVGQYTLDGYRTSFGQVSQPQGLTINIGSGSGSSGK